ELSARDQKRFKAFHTKMEAHLMIAQYKVLQNASPEVFPPLSKVLWHVNFISAIKTVSYDCCVNSCVAYTGVLTKETICPHCSEPCLKPNGQAHRQYAYLPLIPQLQVQYGNGRCAKLLMLY
ncbi:hypothetical protein DACRYDRAFT_50847, partial [Dacryopinax primogenitus]